VKFDAPIRLRPAAWQRWLALACVTMVVALGIFGASSELHAALHGDAASTAGHHAGCAVDLFAAGTDVPVEGVFVLADFKVVSLDGLAGCESGYADPAYRLQPGQAPPRV
jgi:hypothetical protein